MGRIKRFSMIAFVVAAVLGVGVLAVSWFAWEPLLPAVSWLGDMSWFFIAETVVLGITALGLLIILLCALSAPGKSSQLELKRDHGSIAITQNAIQSTVKHVIESHSDLTVKQVKVRITHKRNPRMSVHARVDPGRNAELGELGAKLQDEIGATLEAFAGHPVETIHITFAGDADVVTPAFTKKATQYTSDMARQHQAQPTSASAAK